MSCAEITIARLDLPSNLFVPHALARRAFLAVATELIQSVRTVLKLFTKSFGKKW